jgi:hypothetical protein
MDLHFHLPKTGRRWDGQTPYPVAPSNTPKNQSEDSGNHVQADTHQYANHQPQNTKSYKPLAKLISWQFRTIRQSSKQTTAIRRIHKTTYLHNTFVPQFQPQSSHYTYSIQTTAVAYSLQATKLCA